MRGDGTRARRTHAAGVPPPNTSRCGLKHTRTHARRHEDSGTDRRAGLLRPPHTPRTPLPALIQRAVESRPLERRVLRRNSGPLGPQRRQCSARRNYQEAAGGAAGRQHQVAAQKRESGRRVCGADLRRPSTPATRRLYTPPPPPPLPLATATATESKRAVPWVARAWSAVRHPVVRPGSPIRHAHAAPAAHTTTLPARPARPNQRAGTPSYYSAVLAISVHGKPHSHHPAALAVRVSRPRRRRAVATFARAAHRTPRLDRKTATSDS